MDLTIFPGKLSGSVTAIPSKSQAHRLLICAAFAGLPTPLICPVTNRDMEATAECLNALGAQVTRNESGYLVCPALERPKQAVLNCHDSGSTLRFLLPIVGALGVDATFQLEGRLPQRPLSPLWEEMERMGCSLSRPTPDTVRCQGKLRAGEYVIDGGVSSQFITGLLLAAALMEGETVIHVTGTLESRPYVAMTQAAMLAFGYDTRDFRVQGRGTFFSTGELTVEGDWSNGAFFLAAQAMGSPVKVEGLSNWSCQGDKAADDLLPGLVQDPLMISAADIPDLVPILSVVAACCHGAMFTDIRRLRLKESDRVAAVTAMIEALGGRVTSDENTMTVFGTGLVGGTVDSCNDHRIAMAAAIAATVCREPVTILGAECTEKSYPQFWAEYARLGGKYEQHLR